MTGSLTFLHSIFWGILDYNELITLQKRFTNLFLVCLNYYELNLGLRIFKSRIVEIQYLDFVFNQEYAIHDCFVNSSHAIDNEPIFSFSYVCIRKPIFG